MLTFPTSSSTKKYSIDSCKRRLLATFKLWALLTTQISAVVPLQNADKHIDKTVGNDADETLDKNSENNLLRKATIPRKVLELLVYVLHPEAAPCLGDHILNLSRFSCQTGDTWVASITLRSWRVEEGKGIRRNKSSNEPPPNPSEAFLLPWDLRPVWRKRKAKGKKPKVGEKTSVGDDTIFKPEVSSLILSTNAFGDFSKCTVVSEFIDDDTMKSIVTDARKLWQKFIHQPQTARCLVFFLLLGEFCQVIARHYKTAINLLSSILKLDVSQYLTVLYLIVRDN
jgi:hypothetical protein